MPKDSSARYYQKNKEKPHEPYQNLTEERKNQRREYGRERCKSLQKKVEYRERYHEMRKTFLAIRVKMQ